MVLLPQLAGECQGLLGYYFPFGVLQLPEERHDQQTEGPEFADAGRVLLAVNRQGLARPDLGSRMIRGIGPILRRS